MHSTQVLLGTAQASHKYKQGYDAVSDAVNRQQVANPATTGVLGRVVLSVPLSLGVLSGFLCSGARRTGARGGGTPTRASIKGIVHELHWHHGPVAVYFIRATCGTSQPGH